MKIKEFAILVSGNKKEKIYLDECETYSDILTFRKNQDPVDMKREITRALKDEFFYRTDITQSDIMETNIPELA